MKQFSQQLHNKATTTVKLRAAESRELRERIVSYMEYHPLPAEMRTKEVVTQPAPVMTDVYRVVRFPFQTVFRYGAFAAAVILVMVPFMAEKAVPGDALYAVKVQFNEEIRSTLTFGGYEKVEWETERLNRRIAEARLLASEGRLTEAVEAEVAEAVRTHTENAKREIEVLRAEDADEAAIASIALDTTLEVQSTSLKGEDDEGVSPAATVRPTNLIATALDESREQPEAGSASSTPAYGKLMARVEQNTTRIYELSNQLREVAPADEMAEVDRRIADIERSIEAVVAQSEADESEARKVLVEVLQRTQRLIVFMTEIEVAETVDIETIVPVVLTPEEKVAEMASSTAEVAAFVTQISGLSNGVEDVDLHEKIVVGETQLKALASQMASSSDDFAAFTALHEEAVVLAQDVIELLHRFYGLNLPQLEPVLPVATSSDNAEVEVEVDRATSSDEGIEEAAEATTTIE